MHICVYLCIYSSFYRISVNTQYQNKKNAVKFVAPSLTEELYSHGYDTHWEFIAHQRLLRDSLWDTNSPPSSCQPSTHLPTKSPDAQCLWPIKQPCQPLWVPSSGQDQSMHGGLEGFRDATKKAQPHDNILHCLSLMHPTTSNLKLDLNLLRSLKGSF